MEKRIAISIKLPADLLQAIEAYCSAQVYKPTRTKVIEQAVRKAVGAEKIKARK